MESLSDFLFQLIKGEKKTLTCNHPIHPVLRRSSIESCRHISTHIMCCSGR